MLKVMSGLLEGAPVEFEVGLDVCLCVSDDHVLGFP